MEYRIVEAPSAAALREKVRLLLEAGWHVFGEVSVQKRVRATSHVQALVRVATHDGSMVATEPG